MFGDILEFLRNNNVIPTRAQEENSAEKKKVVLNKIIFSVEHWASKYLKEKDHPEDVLRMRHVMVLTSGSLALGLMDHCSDMDLVCLCSNLVDRKDFFQSYESSARHLLNVQHFEALSMNRCPIIKMLVDDVKVDLSLAVTNKPHLEDVTFKSCDDDYDDDDNDDDDDDLQDGMDEESLISVNGPRNMETLKKMVHDLETYRSVLASVKLWAKRRLVYSYSIGYLGGAALATMVAYVCRQHPNLGQLMTLKTFFEVFAEWSWPNPLLLRELSNKKSIYHPWNPRDDYQHLMPIILPCFPEVNCAYNINLLSRLAIVEELKRGRTILRDVYEMGSEVLKLFNPFDFFVEFRIFLVVIFRSHTAVEAHSCWCGLVESRMKFLTGDLSKITSVRSARIFPEQFSYSDNDERHLTKWYVGLEIDRAKAGGCNQLNLTKEIEKFKSFVYNRSLEYRWKKDGTSLEVVNLIRNKGDTDGSLVRSYLPEPENHFRLIQGPRD